MKSTKIAIKIQRSLENIIQQQPLIKKIVDEITKKGGQAFLVGGAVRDLLLDLPIKDLDIEVHSLSLAQLEELLKIYGTVNYVGKSFGVLRLDNLPIDWSIPRSDEAGRKPKVTLDPFLEVKRAFERRDLTINAMGINLVTFELVDPFDGLHDVHHGILRAPNTTLFLEDPLRFFRVMQFLARFAMQPDAALNELCRSMDISHVSKERIESEFKKWLLQSKKPSLALDWLENINRLHDVFPELAALKNVPQNPEWHPEGDVLEHTKQTIDAAAKLDYANEQEKLIIMYAALCHDLGKSKSTEVQNGKVTSYGHEKTGEVLTKKLLKRITNNIEFIKAVSKMVAAHLFPIQFVESGAKIGAYKRLAYKMSPQVTLAMLAKLVIADKQGRNAKKGEPLVMQPEQIQQFLKKAAETNSLHGVEKPVLLGRDLLPEVSPGPLMGKLVKAAYAMQLNQGITEKQLLKKNVLALLKQEKNKK